MDNKENQPYQVVKLFDSLKKSIEEYGLHNTILLLNEKKIDKSILKIRDEMKYATESVCEAFDISEWLLFSNERKYPRKYAFAIWVMLCIDDLKYSYDNIKTLTGKAKVTLYKAKNFIKEYPNESAFDKKIQEKIILSKEILTNKLNEK